MLNKIFNSRQKGFTLVELLVVMAILGILAAVAIPNITKFVGESKVGAANAELGVVRTAVNAAIVDAQTGTVGTPGTLTSSADVTVATGITVGAYIEGGIARVNGTYTIGANGIITGATYPGGGTFNTATGVFA